MNVSWCVSTTSGTVPEHRVQCAHTDLTGTKTGRHRTCLGHETDEVVGGPETIRLEYTLLQYWSPASKSLRGQKGEFFQGLELFIFVINLPNTGKILSKTMDKSQEASEVPLLKINVASASWLARYPVLWPDTRKDCRLPGWPDIRYFGRIPEMTECYPARHQKPEKAVPVYLFQHHD